LNKDFASQADLLVAVKLSSLLDMMPTGGSHRQLLKTVVRHRLLMADRRQP
jgi:hypothetical protein